MLVLGGDHEGGGAEGSGGGGGGHLSWFWLDSTVYLEIVVYAKKGVESNQAGPATA